MSRNISFFVLIGIIVAVGVLFYQVVAGFFVPLFLAALLTVLFRPLHGLCLRRVGGRRRLSAGITTTAIMLLVLVPVGWVMIYAVIQAVTAVTHFDTDHFQERIANLRGWVGLELPFAQDLSEIESQIDRLIEAAEKNPAQSNHLSALRSLRKKVDRLAEEIEPYAPPDEADQDAAAATDASRGPPPAEAGETVSAEGAAAAPHLTAQQAKEALDSLAWLRRSLTRLIEQDLDAVDSDYISGLREVRFAYDRLLVDITGGPVTAYLARLANPSEEEIQYVRRAGYEATQDYLVSISGTTTALVGEFFLGLFILVVALYFFLADGAGMVEAVMALSPLDNTYEQQLLDEFDRASRAVVLATLATAVTQAALAGLGFFIAGVDAVVLLMVLTAVLSMIPFIGAASVWLPVGLWLIFIDNRPGWGIFILLYGNFIVSMSDNIVKPFILHGQSNIHPLLALISIFGGVNVLGPIGILIGPMIVIFFQTMLKILHTELSRLGDEEEHDRERFFARWGPAAKKAPQANEVESPPAEDGTKESPKDEDSQEANAHDDAANGKT